MTNRKEEIKRLWAESFHDPSDWLDMYFNCVYDEQSALTLNDSEGKIVSSLLLLQYDFAFQNGTVKMGYVAGANTRRASRGNGYMSRLMEDALHYSYQRGDTICALIPAHDWLYFFYDKFGFATVFFVDTQRYTSLHSFAGPDHYVELQDAHAPEIYQAMERMERLRGAGVIHSHRQFLNILDDLNLEPDGRGRFVAIASPQGEVCALAWGVGGDDPVNVKELMAVDPAAATAALRALRKYFPGKAFRVMAPATSTGGPLRSRGMGRIVNVEKCLKAMAADNREWRCTFRISDPIIAGNNGIWLCRDGEVTKFDDTGVAPRSLDYDVDISMLTSLTFSDRRLSSVLRLPCERAHMSLMLD